MKKLLYSISASLTVVACVVALSVTGCVTPGGTVFSLQQAAADLQLAADVGVYSGLQEDPSTRPIFVAVEKGLSLAIMLLAGRNWKPQFFLWSDQIVLLNSQLQADSVSMKSTSAMRFPQVSQVMQLLQLCCQPWMQVFKKPWLNPQA